MLHVLVHRKYRGCCHALLQLRLCASVHITSCNSIVDFSSHLECRYQHKEQRTDNSTNREQFRGIEEKCVQELQNPEHVLNRLLAS